MKIVINTDYGGYGLSNDAIELILARKEIKWEKVEKSQHFTLYYKEGHLGEDEYYIDELQWERNDPDVVYAIETLKEKANTWCSDLKVVDVPDDVEWVIHEFDGREEVHEKHRVWS